MRGARWPRQAGYKWQKLDAKTKQPFHVQPKVATFCFGGADDEWSGDGKQAITTFSIVTVNAPRTQPGRSRPRSATSGTTSLK